MADNGQRSFSSPPSVKRLRSGAFGQGIAVASEVASITLPLDNSLPQWHTNSMNTLDAERCFEQI
jgi:hypothetical protein